MKEFHLTINGQAVSGDAQFDVINPADGTVLASSPGASKAQVDQAVDAAKSAFSSWSLLSYDERRDYLTKFADAYEARLDEFAHLLTQEQGKPLAQAKGEASFALGKIRSTIGFEIPKDVLEDNEKFYVEALYKPLGVVAAITPWNFPLSVAIGKIPMTLLAGNTLVVKPSPYTPLTTLLLGEVASEVFPAGVVNVVVGEDLPGENASIWLTSNPDIAKFTFTGSIPTGKKIAAIAATSLKAYTLELGGNDAGIIFPDVDIQETAKKIFAAAFGNAGQICIAIKRLFVHKDIFEAFVAEMTQLAEAVKLGNGLEEGVTMGPLNNPNQRQIVSDLVEDAKANGATIHCGGEAVDGPGNFYKPTIITGVGDEVGIVKEEQFGPALPILSFETEDEVVARANSLDVGLGASVWSKDLERATNVAKRMESGIAWVNCRGGASADYPFGGMKDSGVGREGGRWGFLSMTETQALIVAK